MFELIKDIDAYNAKAVLWLESLIVRNYAVRVDLSRYDLYQEKIDDSKVINPQSPLDLFRSIIYLTNSYSEYRASNIDGYGRVTYDGSLQERFEILRENRVQVFIERLLSHHNVILENRPSTMIISHDIDTLHHGGIYELVRGIKTVNIGLIRRILLAYALKKPIWLNIDRILSMLDTYDYKSIFYFITEKGRTADRIKNADYDIQENRVQILFQQLIKNKHEIGLHKSSMSTSFSSEAEKLPMIVSNRNHYLKFRIPDHYRQLSDSSIIADSSLCFPYHMGFRNNYGLPFKPFDLETGDTLDVLEIPFQIMDRMYSTEDKMKAKKGLDEMIDFIDSNQHNCVLGMLWHNTELSQVAHPYNHNSFKNLLAYLYESDIKVMTPSEILELYI